MSRLSTSTREKMAVALVKHRFAERAALLIAESRALFHLVYDRAHSPAVVKHMAAITREHKSAFTHGTSLNVNVAGRRMSIGQVSIAGHWYVETERKPFVANIDSYPGFGIDSEDDLGKRIVQFDDDNAALTEEAKIACKEALGTLNQFTTGKRLAEDWPEAMPVIGDLIPEDNRTLPVIQVSALNSKFKLPPAKTVR